ncbi:MAG: hypothetical protein MK212_16090 [Saprospiraceae bacterium]|nr:hypothetical protein [Saprospiraceae bacterium]
MFLRYIWVVILLLLSFGASAGNNSILDSIPEPDTIAKYKTTLQQRSDKSKKKNVNKPRLKHPSSDNICRLAYDYVDDITGQQVQVLAYKPFFTYTPVEYRKALKEKEYLSCEAYLAKVGDQYKLHLKIHVQGAFADKYFQGIAPNAMLGIQALNQKPVYLYTRKGAKAVVEDGVTSYEVSYGISKQDLRKLRKLEVDKIRLRWKKGVQLYDVYHIDYFIEQLSCL